MTAAAATTWIPAAPPADISRTLETYAAATRDQLRHYLDGPARAPYLDELLADYPSRGGKMLRPAICLANARVFGEAGESAARCAAAVEILHNGLLIHDDIQDWSELRRGRPTLHVLHGTPLAINAGDALMFTAARPLFDALRPYGAEVARQALDVTLCMARETAEGQALELGWRDGNVTGLTASDYFRMALKKTAWMGMIWPAQLGLIVGSAGREDPDRLVRFGYFLGLCFQIVDDLRNLALDPGYGKERNGDLYEGKRTLMLIHVGGACDAVDRVRLNDFLAQSREARTEADVLWLANLMERSGSLAYAQEVAGAMGGAAAHEFDVAYAGLPPSEDLDFLRGLVDWVFSRP